MMKDEKENDDRCGSNSSFILLPSSFASAGSRYSTMVGTRVRDRKYEASMAKTTAIAIGRNRYAAGPVRNTTGTNTMQIHNVETNAGVAIWAAPSSIALRSG